MSSLPGVLDWRGTLIATLGGTAALQQNHPEAN
jgi:hypothetical protein